MADEEALALPNRWATIRAMASVTPPAGTARLVQILEAGSVCHDGSYRFWEWDDEECDFTPLAIIALPLPVSNPATDG